MLSVIYTECRYAECRGAVDHYNYEFLSKYAYFYGKIQFLKNRYFTTLMILKQKLTHYSA